MGGSLATPSRQAQHNLHEPIIIDLNPPVPIGILTLEHFGNLLDRDACAHEAVKGDARGRPPRVRRRRRVLALDELDEARCQAVPAPCVISPRARMGKGTHPN